MVMAVGEVEETENRMCYFFFSGWRPTFKIRLHLGQFLDHVSVAVYRAGCKRMMYISLLFQGFAEGLPLYVLSLPLY